MFGVHEGGGIGGEEVKRVDGRRGNKMETKERQEQRGMQSRRRRNERHRETRRRTRPGAGVGLMWAE